MMSEAEKEPAPAALEEAGRGRASGASAGQATSPETASNSAASGTPRKGLRAEDRAARLAEALRANLGRRKAARRAGLDDFGGDDEV